MPNGHRVEGMFNTEHLSPVVNTHGPIDSLFYAATEGAYTDDELWKKYMRDWYGLTALRGWDAWVEKAMCAHKLVGKRCPAGRDGTCPIYMKHHFNNGLWDHARAWKNHDGDLVFTLEPWGNAFHRIDAYRALEKDLDDLGIAVGFFGRSPYGASFLLVLTSKDTRMGISTEALRWKDGWFTRLTQKVSP